MTHRSRTRFPSVAWIACCGLLGLASAGCGRQGPTRYEVSGTVTHEGAPVPEGWIHFEPDESKGNAGPMGTARIHAGKYRTKAGTGVVGGPHLVIIRGFDGVPDPNEPDESPLGRSLFPPFKVQADLPREACARDFEIPVKAQR